MKYNNLTKLALGLTLGLQTPAIAGSEAEAEAAPASNSGDWCSALKSKPTIYKNKENPYIQEIGFEGRFQWQAAYIDGSDTTGRDVNETFDEYRRVRFGTKAKFLNYFNLKYQIDLVSDGRPSSNDLDWGDMGIDEAYIGFDLGKALGDNYFDSIKLKYGMHKYLLGHEATESSKKILTPERSAISNKAYQSGRLTGLMGYAEKNDWTFGAGIYSSTRDGDDNEWASGWQDGIVYWLHAAHQTTDNLTLAWDFAYNDVDRLNGEDDEIGYDWATSLSADYDAGHYGIIADLIIGDNGEQSNTTREGNFYGLMVMPHYWIVQDTLQGVLQLQYMASSDDNGVRANSRYGNRLHTQEGGFNSGRGDSHKSIYAGLNYYLCDHNAKFMGGVEWQEMDTPVGDYDTLTYIFAFRSYF